MKSRCRAVSRKPVRDRRRRPLPIGHRNVGARRLSCCRRSQHRRNGAAGRSSRKVCAAAAPETLMTVSTVLFSHASHRSGSGKPQMRAGPRRFTAILCAWRTCPSAPRAPVRLVVDDHASGNDRHSKPMAQRPPEFDVAGITTPSSKLMKISGCICTGAGFNAQRFANGWLLDVFVRT